MKKTRKKIPPAVTGLAASILTMAMLLFPISLLIEKGIAGEETMALLTRAAMVIAAFIGCKITDSNKKYYSLYIAIIQAVIILIGWAILNDNHAPMGAITGMLSVAIGYIAAKLTLKMRRRKNKK